MDKNRLEAFSDGVLAIIITIMVLSMNTPEEATFEALHPVIPVFVSYLLSFVYVGIYWINHHQILQIAQCINGKILWANLHLLFWISLIPFTTDWVGKNYPVSRTNGLAMVECCSWRAIAFRLLEKALISFHGEDFPLRSLHEGGTERKYFYCCIFSYSTLFFYLCLDFYR
ncbi:MAG: TMEM175 family protein [Bacteroides stercoris]